MTLLSALCSAWRSARRPAASHINLTATVLLLWTAQLAPGSITATYSNTSAGTPVMHALAAWQGEFSSPDNFEKKIQTFGTNFSSFTNTIKAYDGPHLACESRSTVEIAVDPQPSDLTTLSFILNAAADASQIDTTQGIGFAVVDFQILLNFTRDTYISGEFPRNSSTNRGGIRLLHASHYSSGMPVYFRDAGGYGALRAGAYIIDVYLSAKSHEALPRVQTANASFAFTETQPLKGFITPVPAPPAGAVGSQDTYVYYDADAISPGSGLFDEIPYGYRDLFTQSRGHPWYSSYFYNVQYYYVDGGQALDYQFTQDLIDKTWLESPSDPRQLYSATSFPGSYNGFSISAGGMNNPVGLDASGGSALISASYSVLGNSTLGTAYGFMVRIDVDDKGAVIEYSEPPSGWHYTFKNFDMGQPLQRGTYFFGILADPLSMPSNIVPEHPWWQGGEGAISLNVSRLQRPPSKPLPRFTNSSHVNGNFTLQWEDQLNRLVHVQRRQSLTSGAWETVRSNVTTKAFTETNTPTGSAFYRLLVP